MSVIKTACPALAPLVPAGWMCPACGNPGVMRSIVIHHDHIEDYVGMQAGLLPTETKVWDHSLLTAFVMEHRRFPPTLICEVCNRLDGANLKNEHGADRWFSFTPAEMREINLNWDGRRRSELHQLAADRWHVLEDEHGRLCSLIDRLLPLEVVRLRTLPGCIGAVSLQPAQEAPLSIQPNLLPGLRPQLEFTAAAETRRYRELVKDLGRRSKIVV